MKYVMMVYQDESQSKSATEAEMAESLAQFNEFHGEVLQSGHLKEAWRLHHSDTATVVHRHTGQTVVRDGPYAETKEQLGGFYIFECADLDEAIQVAARIPTAQNGYIEIRPVFAG